jgi:hypothetical protein
MNMNYTACVPFAVSNVHCSGDQVIVSDNLHLAQPTVSHLQFTDHAKSVTTLICISLYIQGSIVCSLLGPNLP